MYSLFLYIFALHISGPSYTHPQEHKLQCIPLHFSQVGVFVRKWYSKAKQVETKI
jgi:hypothetical protein